ncbi:MAG: DUF5058 family protein [Clostridia bacterium]|nr:DUF5058 family protein [Clostridia bacterium]
MIDFKETFSMYLIAFGVIAFIFAQSLFFIIKSWKHGKELGITKETMVNTITSSILFSVAPAISILVTVFVLAKALGVVLPWIRLTVIGNLAYETVAAETALNNLGGSLSMEIEDMKQFSTVVWAMTLGSVFPLTFLPIVCKKLQNKIGGAVSKSEKTKKLGDILAAAAFIGIISAFIARAINGCTVVKEPVLDAAGNPALNEAGEKITQSVIKESAGLLSILTLIFAIIIMLVLMALCKKIKALEKFESFAMPVAMFAAMGCAVLFSKILPPDLANFTWYEIGGVM